MKNMKAQSVSGLPMIFVLILIIMALTFILGIGAGKLLLGSVVPGQVNFPTYLTNGQPVVSPGYQCFNGGCIQAFVWGGAKDINIGNQDKFYSIKFCSPGGGTAICDVPYRVIIGNSSAINLIAIANASARDNATIVQIQANQTIWSSSSACAGASSQCAINQAGLLSDYQWEIRMLRSAVAYNTNLTKPSPTTVPTSTAYTSTAPTVSTINYGSCTYQSTGGADGSGWWCYSVPSSFNGYDLVYIANNFRVCYQTLLADNGFSTNQKVTTGEILMIPNGYGCPTSTTTIAQTTSVISSTSSTSITSSTTHDSSTTSTSTGTSSATTTIPQTDPISQFINGIICWFRMLFGATSC